MTASDRQLQADAEREYGSPNRPRVERPEPKARQPLLLQSRRRQEIREILLDARQHHERAGGG